MKFKKTGLLVIVGLLVIGIICGAGAAVAAAAADQDSLYFGAGDEIHVFDKDDVSEVKQFAVPMGYIIDAAKTFVSTGYKTASTASDGALVNLTKKIDEQIKNTWYYESQSNSIAKTDFDKTAANYKVKVAAITDDKVKLMDEPLSDREAVKKTYKTTNPRIAKIIKHIDAIHDYQESVQADTELSDGMERAIMKLETGVFIK